MDEECDLASIKSENNDSSLKVTSAHVVWGGVPVVWGIIIQPTCALVRVVRDD